MGEEDGEESGGIWCLACVAPPIGVPDGRLHNFLNQPSNFMSTFRPHQSIALSGGSIMNWVTFYEVLVR